MSKNIEICVNTGSGYETLYPKTISSLVEGTIPISKGGTGSTTASDAINNLSKGEGTNSVVIGTDTKGTGNYAVAIGYNSSSENIGTVALGTENKSLGHCSIAIGGSSNASNYGSIAMGFFSNSLNERTIAIGSNNNSLGNYSIAMGFYSNSSEKSSIAIGTNSKANNTIAIAIGDNSRCLYLNRSSLLDMSGYASIAIGANSNSSGGYSIALGFNSNSLNEHSIAIGDNSDSLGLHSIAIGNGSNSLGLRSIAIGNSSNSLGNNSTALGYNAQVPNTSEDTIQLGDVYLSSLKCKVSLTTTSDQRDKADIEPITSHAVEFLRKIKAIRYKSNLRSLYFPDKEHQTEEDKTNITEYGMCSYDKEAHAKGIKKGNRIRVGVLAQEVMKAMEETFGDVSYGNIVDDNFYDLDKSTIPEGIENQYTVAYQNFIPFLIKAIQELDERITKLENLNGITTNESNSVNNEGSTNANA